MVKVSPPFCVQGKLTYLDDMPMRHRKVDLFAKTLFSTSKVGELETDSTGSFIATYVFNSSFFKEHTLILRIREKALPFQREEKPDDLYVGTITVAAGLNLGVGIGTRKVDLYSYQDGLPMLKVPEDGSDAPQKWNVAYFARLAAASVTSLAKAFFLGFLGNRTLSGTATERFFYVHEPNLEVSGKNLVEFLTNGVYPAHCRRTEEPNTRLVEINFDRYEKDAKNAADTPNVRISITNTDGKDDVSKISIQYPGRAYEDFTPENPEFRRALFLANCMSILKGEIVSHLGLGHLVTEQNAMAAFRHLHHNPLRLLLIPVLREVMLIDRKGASAIFGEEGILNVSGINVSGIKKALQDVLAGVCYSNFAPRVPQSADDHFAQRAQGFWTVLTGVVDKFFEGHWDDIAANWIEIKDLSDSLVNNSVPYRAWEGVEDYNLWHHKHRFEVDDPTAERKEVNGTKRSMRPITESETPQEGDKERLKQYVLFAMYHATWFHWAVHSAQAKWGSNLRWGNLAPRNEAKGNDPVGNMSFEDATAQMKVVSIFSGVESTTIWENPNGDLWPDFVAAMHTKAGMFSEFETQDARNAYGLINI